jgi:hypothetical protein
VNNQRDTLAIIAERFAVGRHERVKIIIPLRGSGFYDSFLGMNKIKDKQYHNLDYVFIGK